MVWEVCHESLNIILDLSAFTIQMHMTIFIMVKYENQIVRPPSQDFENSEIIS